MVLKTLAADAAATPPVTTTQWVIFRCGGCDYGVPLEHVGEIVTPRPCARLPGSGPEVYGLVAVRGGIVTVADLGVMLGGVPSAAAPDHRLLLFAMNGRRLGAAVDEVRTIAAAHLLPAPSAEPGLLGEARSEEGSFMAVDPFQLLDRVLTQATRRGTLRDD
jgi:chemotaxis signal transduction protein